MRLPIRGTWVFLLSTQSGQSISRSEPTEWSLSALTRLLGLFVFLARATRYFVNSVADPGLKFGSGLFVCRNLTVLGG